MSAANPIAVSGFDLVKVEIAEDTYSRRNAVIDTADFCPDVITDADTEGEVVNALREINQLLKVTEDGRQIVKAPALALGRKIDEAAKTFVEPLELAKKRLSAIHLTWVTEQQRIAREAEEKRQAELKRQQEEAAAKKAELDRQAREAEAAKAEADRKAREATDPETRAKAQQEAKEAQEKASSVEAQKHKEADAAKLSQAQVLRTPAPVAPKAAGTSVSNVWVFEVVDIKALHAARPELVDLVVRRNDIITRIRQGERDIPGLVIKQEVKAVVRT